MTTFPIDKYANNTEVVWITAQRIDGGEWVGRYLSTSEHYPTLDRVLDETPIGEMRRSEFGVFRNSPRILDAKPRLYWRGAEVRVYLSSGLAGVINTVQSDLSFS